jgi:hypothetical protein
VQVYIVSITSTQSEQLHLLSSLVHVFFYHKLALCQQGPYYAASKEENDYSEAEICFPITAENMSIYFQSQII